MTQATQLEQLHTSHSHLDTYVPHDSLVCVGAQPSRISFTLSAHPEAEKQLKKKLYKTTQQHRRSSRAIFTFAQKHEYIHLHVEMNGVLCSLLVARCCPFGGSTRLDQCVLLYLHLGFAQSAAADSKEPLPNRDTCHTAEQGLEMITASSETESSCP